MPTSVADTYVHIYVPFAHYERLYSPKPPQPTTTPGSLGARRGDGTSLDDPARLRIAKDVAHLDFMDWQRLNAVLDRAQLIKQSQEFAQVHDSLLPRYREQLTG